MERAKGIEPSYAAWEAAVLPLNYARKINYLTTVPPTLWHVSGTKEAAPDTGAVFLVKSL